MDENNQNSQNNHQPPEYEVLSPFSINMDDIDTIDIEELEVDDKIDEKEREIRDRIRRIEDEINRRRNRERFSDFSDEQLNDRFNELRDEIAWRTHQENGMEYHEDNNLLEEYNALQAEINRRREEQQNPYLNMSDEDLTRRLIELDEEINYRMHQENGMEGHENDDLLEEYQRISAEIQRRRGNTNTDPYSQMTDEELEQELQRERDNLSNLERFRTEYEAEKTFMKRYDDARNEQRRRQQERNNPYHGISNVELEERLNNLRDEYSYRAHQENGMEGHEDDTTYEELQAIEAEIERRRNLPPVEENEFTSMSDEDLNNLVSDMDDEYYFRVHQQNGMEGNFDDDLLDLDLDVRRVFINGDRTDNLVVGPRSEGFQFSNGEYVSVSELREALENEFERLGDNEVVRCNRTGELVNVDDIMNAILEAAREESRIQISEGNPTLQYANRGIAINDRRDLEDNYSDRGTIRLSADEIPEDYFVRTSVVNDIMKNFDRTSKDKSTDPPFPPSELEYDKNEENRLIRDMLDRYYGNRKKEKLYRKAMATYKSHIITDENGFMTVEDFPERLAIEKEFHLEEYKDRLEAYSRYQHGDLSRYARLLEDYDAIGLPFPLKPDGTEYSDTEKIQILASEDAHYIETFNDNYNSYANTYLNLKTMGKDGEKKPYAHLEPIRDNDGHIKIKTVFANAGKVVLNAGIGAMNIFKVLPNRLLGTYIVAPIQHLIHNSDKKAAGAYTDKRTHRYAQRRDLFEKEFQQTLVEKYRREGRNPNDIKLSDRLKMTWSARFKAIFNWKEGNQKVLTLGAANIRASMLEKARIQQMRDTRYNQLVSDNQACTERAAQIRTRLGENISEEERTNLTNELNQLNERLSNNSSVIQRLPHQTPRGFRTNQTDAISTEVHDKANKDNITHVYHGVKLVGRVALTKIAIPKLMEKVTTTTTTQLPGSTKVIQTNSIDPKKVQDLTMRDLIDSGDKTGLNYDAFGAIPKRATFTDDYVRGFHFKFKDKFLSGTDGVGFDPFKAPISTVKLSSPISKDTKVCDLVASIINKSANGPVTPSEVAKMLSSDPKALQSFFDNCDTWLSSSANGIARGWQAGGKIAGLDVFGTKVVNIPGQIITTTSTINKINPGVVAGLGALGLGQAADIYDDVRRTDSQEEMLQTGASNRPVEEIPEVQRTAREPRRFTNPNSAQNEWGFTGTREGDYASIYNEADIADQAQQGTGGRSR